MSEELQVVQPEMPVATVRISPAEAAEMVEKVNAIISGVLKPGKDYMLIPGTGKPSLLKPGAEALQRFFGFGSKNHVETGELEDGSFFAKATAQVVNQADMVLAEATGWCDDSEKDRRGGAKWKGNRNTIIQMASKRAYVAAVKTATATSDHFTQDMEDDAPAPPPPPPASAESRHLLVELFARKKPCSIPEAAEWRDSMGEKAFSAVWVNDAIVALMLKPQPEPELPADPPPEEATTVEFPIPEGVLPEGWVQPEVLDGDVE